MPDDTRDEGRLTARPHLTRRDEDAAADKVGVTPEDHRAAGRADAIDYGTSGGEPAPSGEGEV